MSAVIKGLLLSVAGPLLLNVGFSESCSGEITGILYPLLASLPGVFIAWRARVKMGGVNVLGVRK